MKELIENKRVALVGPAKYMLNSGHGDEINSHDIVVRINRGPELISRYKEDVGSRTDILYSCLIEKPENAGTVSLQLLSEIYKIKYLVAPPQSDLRGISLNNRLHYMVDEQKVNTISKTIPFRVIDYRFHTALAKKIDCRPNTGFLAMYDLLFHKPELLSIYGFSFYLDGFIPSYKKGIEEDISVNEEQFADKCLRSKRHIQENMWKFCKENLANKDNVRVDPVLQNILNLESFSKKSMEK